MFTRECKNNDENGLDDFGVVALSLSLFLSLSCLRSKTPGTMSKTTQMGKAKNKHKLVLCGSPTQHDPIFSSKQFSGVTQDTCYLCKSGCAPCATELP